jgi:hypothetical protein
MNVLKTSRRRHSITRLTSGLLPPSLLSPYLFASVTFLGIFSWKHCKYDELGIIYAFGLRANRRRNKWYNILYIFLMIKICRLQDVCKTSLYMLTYMYKRCKLKTSRHVRKTFRKVSVTRVIPNVWRTSRRRHSITIWL